MFIAHQSTLVPFMAMVMGDEYMAFSQVRRIGLSHFYLVEYERVAEKQLSKEITFLDNLNQILQMKSDPQVRLLSTMLISPTRLNKSGSWQIDALKEVWCVERGADDRAEAAQKFVLVDGRSYWDGNAKVDKVNLVRIF